MAAQLKLSYATVYKALTTIRQSIWVHAQQDAGSLLGGEVELDESYFGGRRKGKRGRGSTKKTPVFTLVERDGKVRSQVVANVTGKNLKSIIYENVDPSA